MSRVNFRKYLLMNGLHCFFGRSFGLERTSGFGSIRQYRDCFLVNDWQEACYNGAAGGGE